MAAGIILPVAIPMVIISSGQMPMGKLGVLFLFLGTPDIAARKQAFQDTFFLGRDDGKQILRGISNRDNRDRHEFWGDIKYPM
jgi:hypothetical protein